MNKIILAALWIAGWVHVLAFAPMDDSSMVDFIIAVMEVNTELIDPLVFMIFNLLGIWPLDMVAMLVLDDQGKLKAWLFAFSSMFLGNSALYIYLFFRREQKAFVAPITKLVRFAESKLLALFLLGSTIALLSYGLLQGSLSVYVETWHMNYFVNVMTVDFFLFTIAFFFILPDDMRRRNMPINGLFCLYLLVPVLGAVSYLTVRAPLPDKNP